MADHLHRLQAGDGLQEEVLGLRRHRGGDAVRIDSGIIQALRLQEDLVARPVGEADHLILDGGAVAGAPALDAAAIDGGLRQAFGDDPVGLRRGGGDAAGDLRVGDPVCQEGKGAGDLVRRLAVEPVPGDGAAVQARRRAGF